MKLQDPLRPHVFVDTYEAAGPFERAQGLIGADSVGYRRGLLLRGKQVHTFGMTFSIDTVYLRRDGLILKVRTMRPRRFGPIVMRARWILELDAGTSERLGLRPGGYLIRNR